MRFAIDDQAQALREATERVLGRRGDATLVRAGWPDGDPGAVSSVWRKLADTGAVAALVPESAGGLGLDENSIVAMLESAGYSALPAPVVETIAVAAPLLAGVDAARLSDVLSGSARVSADLSGTGLVPYASACELVVLRSGRDVRLYERDQLTIDACDTVDGGRPVGRIVEIGDGVVLTDDPRVIDAAWQRGVLGTSAVLVGLARRMLDMTVAYVQVREQFGVAVGSFQAIKHALAVALQSVEFAGPMVLAAAWQQAEQHPDAAQLTSAAKVLAGDAARLVARTAVQCHGAMGYTTEYDLHLFAKRAWALIPTWGDASWHRNAIANSLGV